MVSHLISDELGRGRQQSALATRPEFIKVIMDIVQSLRDEAALKLIEMEIKDQMAFITDFKGDPAHEEDPAIVVFRQIQDGKMEDVLPKGTPRHEEFMLRLLATIRHNIPDYFNYTAPVGSASLATVTETVPEPSMSDDMEASQSPAPPNNADKDVQEAMDFTGFELPPKHLVARARDLPLVTQVMTTNSFEMLDTPQVEEKQYISQPICFKTGEKAQEVLAELSSSKVGEVATQTFKHFVKLTPKDEQEEEAILACLNSKDVGYYRHASRSNKLLKFVVRGLPIDADPADIVNELRKKGFIVDRVNQMTRKKRPMPLFQIIFIRTGPHAEIPNINHLLGTEVTMEKYRKIGATQCYKCQQWGHSSRLCFMPERCRYCAGPHDSRTCTTKMTKDVRCSNCGENHTSSSARCKQRPRPPPRSPPPQPRVDARKPLQPDPDPIPVEGLALLKALKQLKEIVAELFGNIADFCQKVDDIHSLQDQEAKMEGFLKLIPTGK